MTFTQQSKFHFNQWFNDVKNIFTGQQDPMKHCFLTQSLNKQLTLYGFALALYFLGQIFHFSASPNIQIVFSSLGFALYLPIIVVLFAFISDCLTHYFQINSTIELNFKHWLNFYTFWMPLLGLQFFLTQLHILLSPIVFLMFCYIGHVLFTTVLNLSKQLSGKIIFFAAIVPMGLFFGAMTVMYYIQIAQYKAVTQSLQGLYY